MSAETITLGCRLNFAESETIAQSAPPHEDWIVVNRCAVTSEAVRQTGQAIRRANQWAASRKLGVVATRLLVHPSRGSAAGNTGGV